METVPRNHKRRIAEIAARLPFAVIHDQSAFYVGEPIEASRAWTALADNRGARLMLASDEETATIHIHGGRWFRLWPSRETWEAAREAARTGKAER